MLDECEGVQANGHVLEWRLQLLERRLPEFCRLTRIPASKATSFSRIIRGLIRQHLGPLRHTHLPYQSDVIRPLEMLTGDPDAVEQVLPDILRELRTYSSHLELKFISL